MQAGGSMGSVEERCKRLSERSGAGEKPALRGARSTAGRVLRLRAAVACDDVVSARRLLREIIGSSVDEAPGSTAAPAPVANADLQGKPHGWATVAQVRDRNGWTLLHLATVRGSEGCVRLLLQHGVDPWDGDQEGGFTALHYAAMGGRGTVARILLQPPSPAVAGSALTRVAPPPVTQPEIETPSEAHLIADAPSETRTEIESPSEAQQHQECPSQAQPERVAPSETQIITSIPSGIDARGAGKPPDSLGSGPGSAGVDRRLGLVAARSRDGWTPLHVAASYGHEHVLRLLLNFGADVDAQNGKGLSALVLAVMRERESCVRALLERHADIRANHDLALFSAVLRGSDTICRLLLQRGADPRASRPCDGLTPLHVAALRDDAACSRLLHAHGAHAGTPNAAGVSPFSVCARRARSDSPCLQFLRQAACRPRSLLECSRAAVRRAAWRAGALPRLGELPLPPTLLRYVLFRGIDLGDGDFRDEEAPRHGGGGGAGGAGPSHLPRRPLASGGGQTRQQQQQQQH
uniref:Ankyrin repeat and SOCS box protein 7-like isoform X1 n=2 Tax=Petromyzon marinus TaxID=7757 RepID=A0AAJ7TEV8_PETMA|nr:ankyrin repeat and SOCS box protein 7-like isoform X1 [Petromyzon marinus]